MLFLKKCFRILRSLSSFNWNIYTEFCNAIYEINTLGIFMYFSANNKYKVFAKIGHSQALYWGFTKVISWQLSGNLNLIDLDIYLNCSWIYNYYYSERICIFYYCTLFRKKMFALKVYVKRKPKYLLVSFIFQLWVFTLWMPWSMST